MLFVCLMAGIVAAGPLVVRGLKPSDVRSGSLPAPTTPSTGPTAVVARTSSVLGLGDSVPAGDACSCVSFVSVLARLQVAAHGTPVTVRNDARGGLTSGGLLKQVQAAHLHADPSAITVVTVGANDFDSTVLSTKGCRSLDQLSCYAGDLSDMTRNVARVLALLMSGRHGPVLVTGYWNVFLDGAVGAAQGSDYTRDSDALTREVNVALAAISARAGAWYVDIYRPFKSAGAAEALLLASDGDHPSSRGHVLIARTLEAALAAHGY